MRKFVLLSGMLAVLLSAGTAQAGFLGAEVHGTIHPKRIPPGAQYIPTLAWDDPTGTIGHGIEFVQTQSGQRETANFKNHRLIIRDFEEHHETSTGWVMKFTFLSPAQLAGITLKNSSFGENFHYSVKGNVLKIRWGGDHAYLAMTMHQRLEFGRQRFRAVFVLDGTNGLGDQSPEPVPEPGTVPLLATALLAAAAFGWRRKTAR